LHIDLKRDTKELISNYSTLKRYRVESCLERFFIWAHKSTAFEV